jgi:hypothetical protein
MQPWRRENLLPDLTEIERGAIVTSVVLYHYRDPNTAPRHIVSEESCKKRQASHLLSKENLLD